MGADDNTSKRGGETYLARSAERNRRLTIWPLQSGADSQLSLSGQSAHRAGRFSLYFGRVAVKPAIRKSPQKWSSVRIGDHPPGTPRTRESAAGNVHWPVITS